MTPSVLTRHRDEERALAAAETPSRRRRRAALVGVTLVVYAALLAWSLRIPAGDPWFYAATVLLAAALFAGALGAGRPLRPGVDGERGTWAQRLGTGLVAGLVLLVAFLLGALVVAQVPALRGPVDALLAHATFGALPVVAALTAVNGVAEELFYRGACYDAAARSRPVLLTTLVYAAVAGMSGIALLALAGLAVGAACALLRRWSRGVIAPIACHLSWSLGMLFLLPHVLSLAS